MSSAIIKIDISEKDLQTLFSPSKSLNLQIKLKDRKIYEFDPRTKKIQPADIIELDITLQELKQLFSANKGVNPIFQIKNNKLYEYDPVTRKLIKLGKGV